jgi:AcrR family transcriptional regulator
VDAQVKDKILESGQKQFFKYGIRKISVNKLIGSIGISTKTFYRYYKNKEELVGEVLQVHYDLQLKMLEDQTAYQSVIQLLIDIWYKAFDREYRVDKKFFHDLHYYYPELERKVERTAGQKIRRQIRKIIRKGIRQGLFERSIDPDIALESMAVQYNSVVRTKMFKRFHASPNRIWRNTIVLNIKGICTEKGTRELYEYIDLVPARQEKFSDNNKE